MTPQVSFPSKGYRYRQLGLCAPRPGVHFVRNKAVSRHFATYEAIIASESNAYLLLLYDIRAFTIGLRPLIEARLYD
jgi:hypothetical protein